MASGSTALVQSVKYGLELDGNAVGMILSFEGGNATADVVVDKPGPDGIARKHLASVKYEDIRIACGAAMADSLYDWLQQSLTGSGLRRNGAVVAYGFDGKEVSRLSFFNALVTE